MVESAILVNIAIGLVKGKNEQNFIRPLSTLPLLMEVITTMNANTNISITGVTMVFMSSSLDAIDPIAPKRKA